MENTKAFEYLEQLRPAALEWEKIHGGTLHIEMYIAETEEKTDQKDTDRLSLRQGKYKSFRLSGTA